MCVSACAAEYGCVRVCVSTCVCVATRRKAGPPCLTPVTTHLGGGHMLCQCCVAGTFGANATLISVLRRCMIATCTRVYFFDARLFDASPLTPMKHSHSILPTPRTCFCRPRRSRSRPACVRVCVGVCARVCLCVCACVWVLVIPTALAAPNVARHSTPVCVCMQVFAHMCESICKMSRR